jgi:hypothetical protein
LDVTGRTAAAALKSSAA